MSLTSNVTDMKYHGLQILRMSNVIDGKCHMSKVTDVMSNVTCQKSQMSNVTDAKCHGCQISLMANMDMGNVMQSGKCRLFRLDSKDGAIFDLLPTIHLWLTWFA